MAKLILNGATSGSISIESPAVSGTTTLTLPATSGTVLTTASTFAGTGPAFSAYANSAQTITTSTYTKLTINAEEFDTNNNFDSTTNYRFTPTVVGYYQVNGCVAFNSSCVGAQCYIWKNGSRFKNGVNAGGSSFQWVNVSALIYMNGSTDYLEFYGAHLSGSDQSITTGASDTYFQASFVRSA